jgi:hypothetical protein
MVYLVYRCFCDTTQYDREVIDELSIELDYCNTLHPHGSVEAVRDRSTKEFS